MQCNVEVLDTPVPHSIPAATTCLTNDQEYKSMGKTNLPHKGQYYSSHLPLFNF